MLPSRNMPPQTSSSSNNSNNDNDSRSSDEDDLERIASSKRLTFSIHDDNNNNNRRLQDNYSDDGDDDDDDGYHHSLPEFHITEEEPSHYNSRRRKQRHRLLFCFKKNKILSNRLHNLLTILLAISLLFTILHTVKDRSDNNHALQTGVGGTDPTIGVDWKDVPSSSSQISRVAFGSSSSQNLPQSYWDTLSFLKPDLTVFMGNNVQATCDSDPECGDLRRAYEKWSSHPSFAGGVSKLSVVATLDEWDYGMKGAWRGNGHRDVAKRMFLDFFGVGLEDERWVSDGVYKEYRFGGKGGGSGSGRGVVQVLLLDTRYSRSEFVVDETSGKYIPDTIGGGVDGSDTSDNSDDERRILSERQWSWLENRLSEPADLRLVVSSIQVLTTDACVNGGYECWNMIPKERQRLLHLLEDVSDESRVLILSGNRNVGGFYKGEDGSHLHEITASGWTHTAPCIGGGGGVNCGEKDDRRMGDLVRDNHFGWVDMDWEKRNVRVSLRRVDSKNGWRVVDDADGWTDVGEEIQFQTFQLHD